MPPTPSKRQAIADRERELLAIARKLLTGPAGINGLTMEGLAHATPYSKGTIYQHFCSMEDLLAALMIQPLGIRLELYRKAALFHGGSRERMLALEVARRVIYELHPDFERIERAMNVRAGIINPKRSEVIGRTSAELMSISLGIVREAVARKELALGTDLTPEKVYLALRSLSFGMRHGWETSHTHSAMLEGTDEQLPIQLATIVMDGLGWKPLSRDWDYGATVDRIWRELFPDEARRIGILPRPAS